MPVVLLYGLKTFKYMKNSDSKASKCHLKFSSLMMIFIKFCILYKPIFAQCIRIIIFPFF